LERIKAKSFFDIFESFGFAKTNLGRGETRTKEKVGFVAKIKFDGNRLGQESRLVKTTKIMTAGMERDGNEAKMVLTPVGQEMGKVGVDFMTNKGS